MNTVSVIIPTYNRLNTLRRVLQGLEAQTYPQTQFEVIVVSDGSTDGTDEFLADYAAAGPSFLVRPLRQDNQGVAAARNHGIAAAEGEIILFLDDDVVPASNLIAEHLRLHRERPQGIVVLGPMLTPADHPLSPWVQWEQAMLSKQYEQMVAGYWLPTARQFYTGNTSLPRAMLLAAGGFDSRFRRAEDVELAYRLEQQGVCFCFNPQAVGHHYASRSFASWLNIPYEYGRNDVIFAQEKGVCWLLPAIWREFHSRHPWIQMLAQLCLDRPRLSQWMAYLLKQTAERGQARLAHAACSALFNLRYYQGMADQLGGRELFFAGTRTYAS